MSSLRRKTRQSLTGTASTSVSTSTPTSTLRKHAIWGAKHRKETRGPCKRWARVMRKPAPNVPFQVMKWVPVMELSPDELRDWEEMNSSRQNDGSCGGDLSITGDIQMSHEESTVNIGNVNKDDGHYGLCNAAIMVEEESKKERIQKPNDDMDGELSNDATETSTGITK